LGAVSEPLSFGHYVFLPTKPTISNKLLQKENIRPFIISNLLILFRNNRVLINIFLSLGFILPYFSRYLLSKAKITRFEKTSLKLTVTIGSEAKEPSGS